MISQTDEEVVPILNLEGISAAQSNYRNVINAEIQNSQAVIVTDMSIDAQVYRKMKRNPCLIEGYPTFKWHQTHDYHFIFIQAVLH